MRIFSWNCLNISLFILIREEGGGGGRGAYFVYCWLCDPQPKSLKVLQKKWMSMVPIKMAGMNEFDWKFACNSSFLLLFFFNVMYNGQPGKPNTAGFIDLYDFSFVPPPSTSPKNQFWIYERIVVWNNLPAALKFANNINVFKNLLDNDSKFKVRFRSFDK